MEQKNHRNTEITTIIDTFHSFEEFVIALTDTQKQNKTENQKKEKKYREIESDLWGLGKDR